jgi:hypothetical protein
MEKVSVYVEIGWGRKFNGSYNAETKVQVMQYRGPENNYGRSEFSFRGCPLGRGDTVEEAINDFVFRGREEYEGRERLIRSMIVVARTSDYRVPEASTRYVGD